MARFEYRLNCQMYEFYCPEGLLFSTPTVAICFSTCSLGDGTGYILLRHGAPEVVYRCYKGMVRRYRAVGFFSEADDLGVAESDKWDIEELNKAINIAGYITKFLNDNGCGVMSS